MQYDDAQYGADPYGYPPARSGRRGMLALGGAVVGVAAFAGVIVFAYSRGQHAAHNGAPPLLEADAAPTKTRPQDPGGYEVPHQDKLVYERLNAAAGAKQGIERLLPPPEQPLPRPVVSPQVPPLQPAPVVAVADVPAPQPPAPAPAADAASRPSAAPGQGTAAPSAPPPVVASAPPASALAPAPPAAGQSSQIAALPSAPAKPKPVAPKPAAVPAAPPAAANPATPVKPGATAAGNPVPAGRVPAPPAAHAAAPVTAAALPPPAAGKQPAAAAKPVPVALTPPPATTPAAAPQPATASASGTLVPPSARAGGGGRGGWRVQLASVPSEAQAQGEWKRLSSRHADVLGGLGVSFAQATINGSTYYRVQAGVVDETRARSICASLKAQSVGCILVAP